MIVQSIMKRHCQDVVPGVVDCSSSHISWVGWVDEIINGLIAVTSRTQLEADVQSHPQHSDTIQYNTIQYTLFNEGERFNGERFNEGEHGCLPFRNITLHYKPPYLSNCVH